MKKVFSLLSAGLLFAVSAHINSASAQNSGIWAKISARIVGGTVRFNGYANFNIASRRGKVNGKLNTGSACSGVAKINILFSRGNGTLRCDNGLAGKYKFTLSSRFPIRGKGSGTLKDGRKAVLIISPAN